MKNLIVNGDFSGDGKHWEGLSVTYSDGKAHVASIGHIEQAMELESPLKKGDVVRVKFDLSNIYGSVAVRLLGISYPLIKEAGTYDIAMPLTEGMKDTSLVLRFQASNAFDLDNVSVEVVNQDCVPTQVIVNGDFLQNGDGWSGKSVNYFDGKAHVSGVGHIEQSVELPSPLKQGEIVQIKFDISALFGAVTVSLMGMSYPFLYDVGSYDIAMPLKADMPTTTLNLRFQATSAFDLDNVSMMVCLPAPTA